MPRLAFALRAVTPADVPSIQKIINHYILNTVITLQTEVASETNILSKIEEVQQGCLPFIVAVAPEQDKVVGYTYLSDFRARGGYKHTAEISLFTHSDHLYQGVGTTLLNKMLEIMSKPEGNEFMVGVRSEDRRIRHIIACMAVDITTKEQGLGLARFYESFGFDRVGHFKQVGHKLGRWVDTMYLQKTLW